jgi:hypothetical protein
VVTVAQYAGEIAEMAVGGSWSKHFLHCHPDLKVKMTVPLKKACAKALNRTAVNEFYGILEGIIKEYSILPKNIYNMDEKGIWLGITIIEAVCADGSVLHPSVIFQGVHQNFEWGRNNPCNARCA